MRRPSRNLPADLLTQARLHGRGHATIKRKSGPGHPLPAASGSDDAMTTTDGGSTRLPDPDSPLPLYHQMYMVFAQSEAIAAKARFGARDPLADCPRATTELAAAVQWCPASPCAGLEKAGRRDGLIELGNRGAGPRHVSDPGERRSRRRMRAPRHQTWGAGSMNLLAIGADAPAKVSAESISVYCYRRPWIERGRGAGAGAWRRLREKRSRVRLLIMGRAVMSSSLGHLGASEDISAAGTARRVM